MKLGIAFNIFNGEELLLDSLIRLRPLADYIVLTYQNTSNVGNSSDRDIASELKKLPSYLYDDLILFEPKLYIRAKKNEVKKRNLGLNYAKKNKCSHFMSIDCDEFYNKEEFELAKQIIIENDYDTTACELVNYFHDSKFQMIEKKQYVPFIFKISWFRKHKYSCRFPVVVDRTRSVQSNNFYCFKEDELLMHHMSYVRKNNNSMKSKLLNSPNNKLFIGHMDEYLSYYNDWDESQPALNPHQFIERKSFVSPNVIEQQNPIKLSISYVKS